MSQVLERICNVSDVGEGEMRAFKIDRISLLVVRSGGELFALRNLCPHQGADLATGWLTGTMLPSEVGEVRYGEEGRIIRCPWHNWEFHVESGESLHDPIGQRVRSYPVVVRGEEVYVDTGRRQAPAVEDLSGR